MDLPFETPDNGAEHAPRRLRLVVSNEDPELAEAETRPVWAVENPQILKVWAAALHAEDCEVEVNAAGVFGVWFPTATSAARRLDPDDPASAQGACGRLEHGVRPLLDSRGVPIVQR